MIDTIEEQREIGDEILDKLKFLDGKVTIAGGAVIDWHMNKLARDLDVYIRLPEGLFRNGKNIRGFVDLVVSPLLGIPLKLHPECTGAHEPESEATVGKYLGITGCIGVYVGDYHGMPIDLVIMDTGENPTEKFDCDIARCFVTPFSDGKLEISDYAKDALTHKTIHLIKDNYASDNRAYKRISKLQAKFRDFEFVLLESQSAFHWYTHNHRSPLIDVRDTVISYTEGLSPMTVIPGSASISTVRVKQVVLKPGIKEKPWEEWPKALLLRGSRPKKTYTGIDYSTTGGIWSDGK